MAPALHAGCSDNNDAVIYFFERGSGASAVPFVGAGLDLHDIVFDAARGCFYVVSAAPCTPSVVTAFSSWFPAYEREHMLFLRRLGPAAYECEHMLFLRRLGPTAQECEHMLLLRRLVHAAPAELHMLAG